MRSKFVLTIVLAATAAVAGACDPKTEAPKITPPVATPSPAATESPVASPSVSPTVDPKNPVKPGTSPEVKKPEGTNVNKDVKPAATASPKAK